MKKALLLSLALIALTACGNKYDSLEECYLKEEQKGGRPSTVTNYCMGLKYSYRAVDDAGLDLRGVLVSVEE